jgi:hypothetical protein
MCNLVLVNIYYRSQLTFQGLIISSHLTLGTKTTVDKNVSNKKD